MSNYNPFELRDGKVRISFNMFKNTRREKETHPNAKSWHKDTGLSVSAWTKRTQDDEPFQSCVLEVPEEILIELLASKLNQAKRQSQPTHVNKIVDKVVNDLDDDLPF